MRAQTKAQRVAAFAVHERIVQALVEAGAVEVQRVREVSPYTALRVTTAAGTMQVSLHDDGVYCRFASDIACLLGLSTFNPMSGKYNLQGVADAARFDPEWFYGAAVSHVLAAVHAPLHDRIVQVRAGFGDDPREQPEIYFGGVQALLEPNSSVLDMLRVPQFRQPLGPTLLRLLRCLFNGGVPFRYAQEPLRTYVRFASG